MPVIVSDLFVILLVLLGLTIVCAVSGRAMLSLVGMSKGQPTTCGDLWLGFAMLLACVGFLHLLVTIDWRVSIFFAVVATAAMLINLRTIDTRSQLRVHLFALWQYLRKHYFISILISLVTLVWCLRAMGVPNNFDSGLYHFGSIRWLNEYPSVPGLSNLHWRFGLNQSYFGYLSLVNIYPLWNKGYAVGGLFLVYLVGATLIEIGAAQSKSWRLLVGGISFIFLGYLAGTLPNPSPDTAVGLLELAIFLFLFRLIKNHRSASTQSATTQSLKDSVVILVLSLTLVTIKLSSIAFAGMCVLVVLYIQFPIIIQQYRGCINRGYINIYIKLFVILLLMAAIHLVRGYLLSGVPFFPNTVAAAWQLDWAIPSESVKFETDLIYSWARQPGQMIAGQVLGNWSWVSGWLKTISIFDQLLFFIATLLMLINFILSVKSNSASNSKNYLLLYCPLIAGFLFWFFTAPDIRFLGAIPVLYLSTSLWIFYIQISNSTSQKFHFNAKRQQYLYRTTAVIMCLLSLKLTGASSISTQGWAKIPEFPVEIKNTLTNLPVNVATVHGQCWDAPQPCVSIFNGNVHADPINMTWPFSLLNHSRFFYSVKFLNITK